ncbi:MAG: hypothetical protein LBH92_05870 [Bacteroidales bacterium]|jgi:hypothetical protein|nr:hypothetical protein [Bacteroidales bacterium]
MKKICLTILLIAFYSAFFGQVKYDNRLYYSVNWGLGFSLNSRYLETNNGTEMNRTTMNLTAMLPVFIEIASGVGIHTGFSFTKSAYHFNKYDGENFVPNAFLLNNYAVLNNGRFSFFAGAGYKIVKNKIAIIPYADVVLNGYTSTFVNDYNLKEAGTNNIYTIKYAIEENPLRWSMMAGIDFYFHIKWYWGIKAGFHYTFFKSDLDMTIAGYDYISDGFIKHDVVKLNCHDFFITSGIFWSFNRKD